MKSPRLPTRARRLREAAATIFTRTALLPLLVFVYLLWRYQLVTETEAQVALFLALLIALLGFVVFHRLVGRISTLAETVTAPNSPPVLRTRRTSGGIKFFGHGDWSAPLLSGIYLAQIYLSGERRE